MSSKAIRIHAYGGPEVMQWEDVPTPEPGPGEALVHHEAVGLNYIDVYFRTGLYKSAAMPVTLGMEGAGTVKSVGPEVTDVRAGDRVAYAGRDRRLRDRTGDRRRQAGEAARRDRLQDRRRHDAAGHDSAVPRAPHLPGEGRRYDRGPRGGRRRRADPVPVGQASRCHRDRRGLHRAEGGDGPRAWRGAHDHRPRQSGRRGQAHHRRAHGAGGLRQRRPRHLHAEPRQPCPARSDGELRQRLRPGAAVRHVDPGGEGQPVSSPVRRSPPTPPSAPTWKPPRTSCSTWCRRAP